MSNRPATDWEWRSLTSNANIWKSSAAAGKEIPKG